MEGEGEGGEVEQSLSSLFNPPKKKRTKKIYFNFVLAVATHCLLLYFEIVTAAVSEFKSMKLKSLLSFVS